MLKTVPLNTNIHDRKNFDCGIESLNNFLKQLAAQSARKSLTKTTVLVDSRNPSEILGFYTLGYSDVAAPPESKVASYPHNMPAIKLMRMAVSLKSRGNRFGEQLLLEVIDKTAKTASIDSIAPTIGLFVDAKENAKDFYLKYGFIPVDTNSNNETLWLPIQNCIDIHNIRS